MKLFYKTKDGKMELLENVPYIEVENDKGCLVQGTKWVFDETGERDGRADL